MSVYPDTKRPMQLCAAMVTGMPVYEATGVETKKADVRQAFTYFLLSMVGDLYLGCYSIGEPFRISYLKLLDLQGNLLLKDEQTMAKFNKYTNGMDPLTIALWIDKLLEDHQDEREIEFKWMTN